MLQEERSILWYIAALAFGLALPGIMLGNGIMYGLTALGVLSGLLATKDASLRATLNMIRSSRLVLLFMCLMVTLGLSAFLGIQPDYSLHKTAEVLGVLVIALLLFVTLREMPGRYTVVLHETLVIAVLMIVAFVWVDAFSGSERFSAAMHGADKALTRHRLNFHSTALAVLLPFVWAHYARRLREKHPLVKMSAPLVLPLSWATIFLCGGRGGILAALVALVAFFVLGSRSFNFNAHAKHWLAVIVSTAAGVFAYMLSRGGPEVLLERLEVVQSSRGLGGGRAEIWQTAWNHLLDSPLLGIGPNAFRFLPENVDFHPHNSVLQVALETGLIGFVLTGGIAVILLTSFYRYAKGNIFGLAALCGFLAYLTSSLVSKSVFDVEWMSLLTLLLLVGWRLGWSSGHKPAGQVVHANSFMDELKQGRSDV